MRAPLVKFPNPIHLDKLTKVIEIRGVDTYVHWSVFAVSAFILANVVSHPGLSILGLCCYYGVLLIHEAGHLYAAQRKGCQVLSIRLYPIFGLTTFEAPCRSWTTRHRLGRRHRAGTRVCSAHHLGGGIWLHTR
jgi:hypothetical protein